MSIVSRTCAAAALAVTLATPAFAAIYNDATGEALGGHLHIDIASVEVSNTGSDIMFKINLAGDPIATDWGKYLVAIDSIPGGDPAGNGWGRPILMPSGMDYFIGSWVDWGDGAEVYSWGGASWNLNHATYNPPSDIQFPAKTTSSVTLTTTLASLGLSMGDSFVFDVWTTGGGGTDSAVDALANPLQTVANWSDPYTSGSALQYTVVPEPTVFALAALGATGLYLLRRRNR